MSGIEQRGVVACKNDAPSRGPAAHVVVIALSAGGLLPVRTVVAQLPSDLPAAVVVSQHVRGLSYLPEILQVCSRLRVKFAEAGEQLECGTIYVGPPGRHVIVAPDGRINLANVDDVEFASPSADWLFDSVAAAFSDRVVAIVLSGRLRDGARGVTSVQRAGGYVIAQEPSSCRFPDMPIAAIQTGAVDVVLAPERVGAEVVNRLATRGIASDALDWAEPFSR